MLHAVHSLLSRVFSDSGADIIFFIIQSVAFVGALSIGLAAIGIDIDFLPKVNTTQSLVALIFLLAIALPNVVDYVGGRAE